MQDQESIKQPQGLRPVVRNILGGLLFAFGIFSTIAYGLVPKFEAMFADMDVELPGLTIVVLSYYKTLTGVGLFLCVGAFALMYLMPNRRWTIFLAVAALMFLLLNMVLCTIGVYLPTAQIVSGL